MILAVPKNPNRQSRHRSLYRTTYDSDRMAPIPLLLYYDFSQSNVVGR